MAFFQRQRATLTHPHIIDYCRFRSAGENLALSADEPVEEFQQLFFDRPQDTFLKSFEADSPECTSALGF